VPQLSDRAKASMVPLLRVIEAAPETVARAVRGPGRPAPG
jgi:hypothetical protein